MYTERVLPGAKKLGHAGTASSHGGKRGRYARSQKQPRPLIPGAGDRRLASLLQSMLSLAPAAAFAFANAFCNSPGGPRFGPVPSDTPTAAAAPQRARQITDWPAENVAMAVASVNAS